MICISYIVYNFLTVFNVKLCNFTKSVQGKHDLRKSFHPFLKMLWQKSDTRSALVHKAE